MDIDKQNKEVEPQSWTYKKSTQKGQLLLNVRAKTIEFFKESTWVNFCDLESPS